MATVVLPLHKTGENDPAPTPYHLHLHSGNLMELLQVKLIELWPSLGDFNFRFLCTASK